VAASIRPRREAAERPRLIRLVESPSAAERIAVARDFLLALPPSAEALVIGASRDAADDLVRRVTIAAGATFGLHRASLLQLAARAAGPELARTGAAPAAALGVQAVAARIAFESLEAGELAYFGPVARFPGFARAVASTLQELRLSGVSGGALRALGPAGQDVGALLARFESALAGALADRAALFELATAAVSRGEAGAIGRGPIVLLDVPVTSLVERAFVAALLAAAPAALATVPAGDDRTRAALEALGARPERSAQGSGAAAADTSALAHLRRHLFSDTVPARPAAPGEAVFFSAPGEGREAVEIARRILEEARAGTPFDRIAVLLRAPQVYASLFETAFGRAGIAAFFARGARRPDPAGRAFLVLLDCALEKLSARRFAEYLSLGQVPALGPEGAPPPARAAFVAPADEDHLLAGTPSAAEVAWPSRGSADGAAAGDENGTPAAWPLPEDVDAAPVVAGTLRAPWRWERLLVDSAVIGGRERWSRRLAGLAAEMGLKLEELRQEEADSPRLASLERDLENLGHLERFALPVIDRLASLPTTATWGEWIAALESLAPMVLGRPERVLAVLAELRALGPIGPVGLDEVRDVLGEELATLALRPDDAAGGQVFVGMLEHARGREFDVVFVPGLAERVFPQKPREDPILLDALRRDLGADLTTQSDRAHHERLLLRLAVGAATRRAYLSYSRLELLEARARVPSFYAMEVQRALAGRIPDPQTLEREAAEAGGARLAWPAPDDPARAIDEVEHDLSSLAALLRPGAPPARGRARYLLDLNDRLARSLRTRWARWRPRFTPYDGIVQLAPGTRDALLASRLNARAYSPSALQRFAACPYQFYLSAIWRLAPRDEIAPLYRLDPLIRGSLFHEVQAQCLRALQREGQLPLSPATLPAAIVGLEATLERVAAAYEERLAPAIARVWRDEIDALGVDLRTWLERSVEGQAEWEPFAFELAFGLPGGPGVDPRSVRDEVTLGGQWRLRGIVDLIERWRGGPGLRVTDHKTGINRTASGLVVGKGEALQPVLYGLAVEQVFGEPVRESRLSYCTRAGEFSERVVPMNEAARRRGLEVLELIDRAVGRGFLPPAPRTRACSMCDFVPVCGPVEELRVAVKDARALEELTKLRGLS
jgi:ATP-dependent helicase/nuclease subunit B